MTVDSKTIAENFLRALFPDPSTEDRLTLWSLQNFKTSYHIKFSDPRFSEHVARLVTLPSAYYALGVKPRDLGPRSRGFKADVTGFPGLVLDVDVRSPAHRADNLPSDLDEALSIIEGLPDPTMVVDSGWGYHFLWLFPTMWRFAPGEYHEVEKLSRALHRFASTRAKEQGWHLDDTSDVSRVLRLPGSYNNKIPTDPRLCQVLLDDSELPSAHYGPGIWQGLLGKVSSAPTGGEAGAGHTPPPSVGSPGSTSPTEGEVEPASAHDLAPSPSDLEDPLPGLRRALLASSREECKALAAGKSFARPGERDSRLASLTQTVVNLAPRAPIEKLIPFFLPSLAEMRAEDDDPNNPPLSVEDVEAKLFTAKRKKTAELAADEKFRQALKEKTCGTDKRPLGKLIVQCGPAFYVHDGQAYKAPIGERELELSLPRDWAKLPIEWNFIDEKGKSKKKSLGTLLRDHGVVARKSVAHLSLAESYYDEATETFHEAVCPVRDLTPAFDPRVETWLNLLGGAQAEKLLDWIATVTDLDAQTCALYLSDTKGTGKTMLACGLARLWTTGAPTEIGAALGSYNSLLTKCPLIFADEHVPKSFQGPRGSAELRQLIGTNCRALKRKYMHDSDLVGSIRFVLASNNQELLSVEGEELTQDDLQAVASRFLHIRTTPAAADYLTSIGGRTGTAGWVDGDIIARHALWLRDNRSVVPGARFLVEGELDEVHNRLAAQGNTSKLVQIWIAKFLHQPDPQVIKAGVRIGNGRLLVNSTAMCDYWSRYIPETYRIPSITAVGRALRNLSFGEVRRNALRFHNINLGPVYQTAEDNQIGDLDAMRARVDKRVEEAECEATTATAGVGSLVANSSGTSTSGGTVIPLRPKE